MLSLLLVFLGSWCHRCLSFLTPLNCTSPIWSTWGCGGGWIWRIWRIWRMRVFLTHGRSLNSTRFGCVKWSFWRVFWVSQTSLTHLTRFECAQMTVWVSQLFGCVKWLFWRVFWVSQTSLAHLTRFECAQMTVWVSQLFGCVKWSFWRVFWVSQTLIPVPKTIWDQSVLLGIDRKYFGPEIIVTTWPEFHDAIDPSPSGPPHFLSTWTAPDRAAQNSGTNCTTESPRKTNNTPGSWQLFLNPKVWV